MNYWLVRAKWGGVENKKTEFINNDEWINGYDNKYLDTVNRVQVDDILLLAEDSSITHYGVCVENPSDGRRLLVDKWILLKNSIHFPGKGAYIKTIVKVNDGELIKEAKQTIDNTVLSNDIKIKTIDIENFTVFKNKHTLEFSSGLNITIGENGLGKTHLLKLLFSLIMGINDFFQFPDTEQFYLGGRETIIQKNLMDKFKPDSLNNLISYNKKECSINTKFDKYHISFNLYIPYDEHSFLIKIEDENIPIDFFKKNAVFIPAKEILSFYEGFIPLYENRETSFDAIYYNLAKSLSLPLLKNIDSYPVEYKIILKLEEILEGKIILENGRFYLLQNNRKTEISLCAEGLRKIGMIVQLLANGSLNKNSILFWDEPETNLNPRLIRKMAEVLMELSRAGMQIFIATHSLFLVKEIEILRKKEDKVRYFGLGFDKNKEIRVSQSEDFEYLDDIVILDEAFKQNDRFLSKEDN